MRYSCVDPAEFLYPDITDYQSSTDKLEILTPRNSFACGQILFTDVVGDTLQITCEGWTPEIYEMVAIPVECNHGLDSHNRRPHQPERIAPYMLYDCLKPARGGTITVKNGTCAVYFAAPIAADAIPGTLSAKVTAADLLGTVQISAIIQISTAIVPKETLTILMGYNETCVAQYHKAAKHTAEFEKLDDLYLSMLRRSHQNMLYCPHPDAKQNDDGTWEIDFSNFEAFIRRHMAYGFTKYNFGLGFRRSWSASEILVNGMPSMSFACYRYLAKLLPALESFLKERGWLDHFMLGIADEPNAANATEYRALCGLVRKMAPSIKLLDAMSFGPVHGAIDIWIPLNAEYEQHQKEFEIFRENGDEMWYYDCCGPRGGGYINRFMDYPLLATRYHFWASYHYHLPGYLHWAANFYQPGQDPFQQSCPEHHNADSVCILPAGDTHLIYPGDGEPWMSVRLENQRASAEEYEMLCALAKTDTQKADEICDSVFHAFSDVEYDIKKFRAARNALIHACEL